MHAATINYDLCKMSHFAADYDEVSSGWIKTPERRRELPVLGIGIGQEHIWAATRPSFHLQFVPIFAFDSVPETVRNCVSRSPLPREPNYAACQTELHKMSGGKESVCDDDDADDAQLVQSPARRVG